MYPILDILLRLLGIENETLRKVWGVAILPL
jgi:hypothetical protein